NGGRSVGAAVGRPGVRDARLQLVETARHLADHGVAAGLVGRQLRVLVDDEELAALAVGVGGLARHRDGAGRVLAVGRRVLDGAVAVARATGAVAGRV